MYKYFLQISILLALFSTTIAQAEERPNILLIIADDLGVDALNGYDVGTVLPNTPNLDKLREGGLTFTRAWACPACAPTRAAMLTGKYGAHTGINTVPGILGTDEKSIFKEVTELTDSAYKSCVIGKWHNSRPTDIEHPYSHGADEFMGVNGAGVEDYYKWDKVENHASSVCTEYATTYFTDYAAQWINKQTSPWFMWFAHVSPHTPFHVPPTEMYTSENVTTNLQKFMAMIEAMDYDIGRLLDSIPQDVLDNTVIMVVGDNGTAGNILQTFPKPLGKNTVYQGGVHVPLIVSGKGVTRINETEDAMINVTDIYATIAQIAQADAYPSNMVNDSYSFKPLLSDTIGLKRAYNYMELGANITVTEDVYTIRDERYKIIYDAAGKKEMFDLLADPYEGVNLLTSELSDSLKAIKLDLEVTMKSINGITFAADVEEDEDEDTTVTPPSLNKYTIVDTDVDDFYSDQALISEPSASDDFYGQDATYKGHAPSYKNNGDGTITDLVTGLMWEQDMGEKISYVEAFTKAANSDLGDYTDWRVPTIKELYSLILFSGQVKGETAIKNFIDDDFFNQPIGDTSIGEREIDAQTWSSTQYVGLTMNGDTTVFGVNFVDGRIKGYPKTKKKTGAANAMYFRMVRDNVEYGINNFEDNEDNTISDLATGLMWETADDGVGRDWEEALAYAEGLELGGHSDWRLPNAKELQSIVDYSRSPQTTHSPAIDPIFQTTEIKDPEGNAGQYPFFWSSTTHLDGSNPYEGAVYVAFGEGQGQMNNTLLDVHGAGCQRSDPKSGNESNYPKYFGPQGDVQYVYNYVRCVRDISTINAVSEVSTQDISIYPNPVQNTLTIQADRIIEKVAIFNYQGQRVGMKQANDTRVQMSTSHLSNGIYFVLITDEVGQITTEKMVVKH